MILVFGFKLRSNIEAIRASNHSPLKSLILNDIGSNTIAFILAIIGKYVWQFDFEIFSLVTTLSCLCTKLISFFIVWIVFAKRYSTKHSYEFLKT